MSKTTEEVLQEHIENSDVEPVEIVKGLLTVTANIVGSALEEGDDPVEFEFSGNDGTKCVISVEIRPNEVS